MAKAPRGGAIPVLQIRGTHEELGRAMGEFRAAQLKPKPGHYRKIAFSMKSANDPKGGLSTLLMFHFLNSSVPFA